MSRLLYLCFLVCISSASLAEKIEPFKGPQPIAVFIQTNPWLMVIGSDTPRLVIYDDGDVVFSHVELDKSSKYLHKSLTLVELAEIKKKLASFGDYSAVRRRYNIAPNVTDLPETMIYLNLAGKVTVTSVYGLMESGTSLPAFTELSGANNADKLPEALSQVYQYLLTLKFVDAKPWQPKYLEVMIWPYSYAPDKSIHWPKDWPGLDSPETVQRGDAYSIFLPASEIQRLTDFLKTRKEKGAVEVGGKKWAVSFRYVFPSEPVWMRAFRS